MRYTVYKTVCLANGKFYIGVHETENPDDAYLGSGKLLSRAIKKYGRAAFRKEVLHDLDSREEMYAKEREVVTEELCASDDNYNLLPGGHGGWYVANQLATKEQRKEASRKGNKRRRELLQNPEWAPEFRRASANTLRRWNKRASAEAKATFTGRKHTEETKAKIGVALKVAQAGQRNSQHGTVWVCRAGESPRKIKKTELLAAVAAGWQRGRKVNPPF